MADKEQILAALAQLDPLDDDHWTSDGAPRIDAVEKILGSDVSRKEVVEAAPKLTRETAGQEPEEEQEETTADPEQKENDDAEGQGLPEGEGRKEEVTDEAPAESVTTLAQLDRPLTEREFAHFLGSVPKEELEDVVALLRLQLGEASKAVKDAQDLEARVKRSISFTESRIKAEFPNTTDRDATRKFIETQTRLRAERVAKRQEIFGKIDPSEFDPRAPIDRAMARKTKRGGQRPNRPLLK